MSKAEPKIDNVSNTRSVLIVLFIPSADRQGRTLGTQDEWKGKALEFFGEAFGGATALPRSEGVWRDDENGGALIRDFPILVHCYVTEEQVSDKKLQTRLQAFCRRMGKDMKQGEVAMIIDGQYHGVTHFG